MRLKVGAKLMRKRGFPPLSSVFKPELNLICTELGNRRSYNILHSTIIFPLLKITRMKMLSRAVTRSLFVFSFWKIHEI